MPLDKQTRAVALIFLLSSLAILAIGLVSHDRQATHIKKA
jgi:hypothetical protein